uniref:Ephrin RBD domain-containing protein n=1 Tax=Haemonchus placei TaxID=6290 RepID=A0A0N4WMY4_HAEPC
LRFSLNIFFLQDNLIIGYIFSSKSIVYFALVQIVERFAAIGDSLDIICPYYDPDEDQQDAEQSIIYRVSEHDYETCTLSSSARELGRCISPNRRDKVKVSFRLMSPNPSALDYRPGQTYFFITTSTGSRYGLDNKYGGLCASHHLKMVIHVTDKNGDTSRELLLLLLF